MLINVFFIIFLFFMKYILKFIPLKFIPKDYLISQGCEANAVRLEKLHKLNFAHESVKESIPISFAQFPAKREK